jgi:hypothetical protein
VLLSGRFVNLVAPSAAEERADGFAEQRLLEKSGFDASVVDADGWRTDVKNSSFLLLTLDIPPCPLFCRAVTRQKVTATKMRGV